MKHAIAIVGRFVGRDDAQDLLEYGLVTVLIAIVALAGVRMLGSTIYTVFWQRIGQAL